MFNLPDEHALQIPVVVEYEEQDDWIQIFPPPDKVSKLYPAEQAEQTT